MAGRLDGKVAIITGGGTGIGEAIAKKFVTEGAIVLISGLPDDPVKDVVDAISQGGGVAMAYIGDVGVRENAEECVRAAVQTFGKLDILINNAGTLANMAEIDQYYDADFENLVQNNIRTVYHMTKAAIPELKKTRGCIVSAGSEAGVNGSPKDAPYGGTKAWIHAFMLGIAVEQSKYGVRANCVCPGPIDTEMTRKELGPMDKKAEQMTIDATPLGRRGTPEEVANVYAFLASDEASYVTGALWLVDGGITIAHGPVGQDVPNELKKPPKGTLILEHSQEPNQFSQS